MKERNENWIELDHRQQQGRRQQQKDLKKEVKWHSQSLLHLEKEKKLIEVWFMMYFNCVCSNCENIWSLSSGHV